MSSTSGVKEPTAEEFTTFITFTDIMVWSKLKGSIIYPPSQQGSLLTAIGADIDISIDEFAAIPPDEFDQLLCETWYYSASEVQDDGLSTELCI